jgi:hypothetical protein
LWSVNEPFGPTFPSPTFNFILWTDQALTDVTEVITYTLALPPGGLDGDYNDDDVVDAADYVVWRKYQGTTSTLPNDPHGGTIGVDQFNTWRANFGETPGGGSGSAVPEPATAWFLLSGLIAIAVRRRS